jgi:DNA-binding IclR family transcriptional regulator
LKYVKSRLNCANSGRAAGVADHRGAGDHAEAAARARFGLDYGRVAGHANPNVIVSPRLDNVARIIGPSFAGRFNVAVPAILRRKIQAVPDPKMAKRETTGLRTLDRAIEILRLLGVAADHGLRLVDVQNGAQLARPTVHRILAALSRNGLVVQDGETKRYRLGQGLAILGLSVPSQSYLLRDFSQGEIEELAHETGDTAFLMVRFGYDTVCIDRKLGPYPIKTLTVDIGTRRPLGVGASGIAILASLDDREAEGVYAAIRGRLSEYANSTERSIRSAVRAARDRGYAFSDGFVLSGVRGLGVVINDPHRVPVAALSVAAVRDRVTPARLDKLVSALNKRKRTIERRLASGARGR